MGMFVVTKSLVMSNFIGPYISYNVMNRKTGEVVGTYQQLGIANAIAGGMNRGV